MDWLTGLMDGLNDESLRWPIQCMVRLTAAAMLGAIIGAERQFHGRSAGFRTQLLVALGAALAMLVSLNFGRVFADAAGAIRVDPARIAYGIMGGVGFLGAGAIIQDRLHIRGMTTASSLWCTAATGLACGFGMYAPAVFVTLLALFALTVLDAAEKFIPARQMVDLHITVPLGATDALADLTARLKARRMHITHTQITREYKTRLQSLSLRVSLAPGLDVTDVLAVADATPDLIEMKVS